MADVTKEKILKINTQGAEKNVKSLKTQIKELKEQLAQLDKGTAEYDKVSKQLADTNQKQIEINEAMKYSNRDLGATLSNLTKVSAGVIGAINGINSVMVMMGGDSEEAQEAMKTIQMTMALIQGMSAVDVAVKALKGLTVAFKDFNVEKGANALITAGATTSELLEAGALTKNTVEMNKNNTEARTFNELNEKGKEATDKSKAAIDRETESLIANKKAKSGSIEAAQKYIDKLDELNAKRAEQKNIGQEVGADVVNRELEEAKKNLAFWENELNTGKKLPNEIEYIAQRILQAKNKIAELENATKDASQNIVTSLSQSIKDGLVTWDDEIEGVIDDLVDAASVDELGEVYSKTFQQQYAEIEKAQRAYTMGFIETEEELEESTSRIEEYYEQQRLKITQAIDAKKVEALEEEKLRKKIFETTQAENGETAAVEANTDAKEKNALATEGVADAEGDMAKQTKKNEPVLRSAWAGITKGIKNAASALKTFVMANPILTAIIGLVTAIGVGIGIWAKNVRKSNEEWKKQAEYLNTIKAEFDRQKTDVEALLRMFDAENTSMEQKEVLAKEINKLTGEELIKRNEITGEWEKQEDAMNRYIDNLHTQIELEYHKKQIEELIGKEEEAYNNAIDERSRLIGKLFKTASGYEKEAAEYSRQQKEHWEAIERLTAGTVRNLQNQNKEVTTTTRRSGGGIVKAFKDIAIEIRDILVKSFAQLFDLKELKMRYNGVYTETEYLLLKIKKTIESQDLAGALTEQFKNALTTGDLRNYGITFDYIFDKAEVDKMVDQQVKAYEKLQKILEKKKGGSATDKEVQAQKTVVEEINKQIAAMKELADAVQAYADAWDKIEEKQRKHTQTDIQYNRELKAERDYMLKRSSGDINAETERSVKLAEIQLQVAEQQYKEDKQHLDLLRQKVEANQQNQKIYEDYLEYQEKVQQSEKDWYDAMTALDNEYYNQRQERVKQFYDNYEKETEKAVKDISGINNFFRIMHFDDYNSEVIALETQRTAMDALEAQIVKYYNDQLEIHKNNAQMVELLKQEKNAALLQMHQEQADKDVEIEEAKVRRKIEIQRTYVNLYQNLSSQISSLLSAEMSNYDENSSKYKKLKYAQGVTDTLSGTLSAFMSGIESGVPAPWNLGVAVAMAGITFATGLAQLKNIKNGSLSNSATASPVNMEYDTLSYAQNAEILSAIQDQKVYVLESEISSTQNRVRVMEDQSTF